MSAKIDKSEQLTLTNLTEENAGEISTEVKHSKEQTDKNQEDTTHRSDIKEPKDHIIEDNKQPDITKNNRILRERANVVIRLQRINLYMILAH